MATRVPALSILLLLFWQLPLAGQAAIRHTDFALLRDSLTATTDTKALRVALKRVPKDEPLRAGVIGLRLGELRADPDFSQAISHFRRAARQHPGRHEPWYGLGLAERGRSYEEMRDPLRLGSRVGLGTLERSANHHARALLLAPKFVPAALALAEIELSLLDTVRIRRARDLVRRSAQAGAHGPELLLSWGRLERAAGALEAAAFAFQRYLARGGNRAVGLLELARTRLAQDQPEGEAAYYAGASLDDPDALAGYRADLALIAADSILNEFDRLDGRSRAAFLHRFWTDRDHFELRPEGHRLREHYRRLTYARRHFPLTVSRRFYGRLDAYRSGSTEVDDRGIIYMRHGEPASRIRPFIFRAMPNESWRYVRAEGDLLFHFSAGYDRNGGGDLYDYRLVESVLDLRGADDAPRDQLILSRQSLSPIYNRMLNWGRYGAANAQASERSIGATSIEVGTTTDAYELQFKRRLGAVADLVSVGRRNSGSLAHLVFGIAASGVTARQSAEGVEYPVRVRVVALDRHDRAVARLDTIVVIRHQRELHADEWLVGRAELRLPGGQWTYRAALEQGESTGVLLPRNTVRVANTDGTTMGLSDIALGSPGRAVPWITDVADTVLLAPSALFRRGVEVETYYEVTGATAHEWYRHDITVLRPEADRRDDARRPLVSLSFSEQAAGEVIRSRRTVRLERLKPGSYFVEVRVTAPNGRSQVRRRLIQLMDR